MDHRYGSHKLGGTPPLGVGRTLKTQCTAKLHRPLVGVASSYQQQAPVTVADRHRQAGMTPTALPYIADPSRYFMRWASMQSRAPAHLPNILHLARTTILWNNTGPRSMHDVHPDSPHEGETQHPQPVKASQSLGSATTSIESYRHNILHYRAIKNRIRHRQDFP